MVDANCDMVDMVACTGDCSACEACAPDEAAVPVRQSYDVHTEAAGKDKAMLKAIQKAALDVDQSISTFRRVLRAALADFGAEGNL